MIFKISQYTIDCDAIDCDNRGDGDVYDGWSKKHAVQYFRKYGWSIGKRHLCPKCKLKESKNGKQAGTNTGKEELQRRNK